VVGKVKKQSGLSLNTGNTGGGMRYMINKILFVDLKIRAMNCE
jgi:hypothetical protein